MICCFGHGIVQCAKCMFNLGYSTINKAHVIMNVDCYMLMVVFIFSSFVGGL